MLKEWNRPIQRSALKRLISGTLAAVLCAAVFLISVPYQQAYAAPAALRSGDQGAHIKLLQQQLKKKGYYTYDEITDFYGEITKQSIASFQRMNNLDPDGVAGEQTLRLLFGSGYDDFINSISQQTQTAANPDSGERKYSLDSLIPGDESEEVTKLQKRLKELGYYTYDRITNYYGPITQEAVKKFQAGNGLEVDGIAGKQTRNAAYSSSALTYEKAKDKIAANMPAAKKTGSSTADKIIDYAREYMGCRYVYGANGPNTFDCSGFTKYVFANFGYTLPRTARDQGYSDYGVKVDRSGLQKGDLVFFNTISDNDLCDHAGIYIGGGQFIHASSGSSRKVVISTLDSGYYKSRFSWGRRVL